jgi:hypothetical protein
MARFKAKLEPARGGGHVVVVPDKIADTASLSHLMRVRGTVGGAPYRSSLMSSQGTLYLGVHKATIAAAGTKLGATLAITIEPDREPRPADTVPSDLQRALKASKRAHAAWQALAPSHRREHVRHVTEAKLPETRARRIATTIATLEKTASARPAKAPPRARAAPSRAPRAR